MLLNFAIPKSGSTFIHLVLSEYLIGKGYLSREEISRHIEVPGDLNANTNIKAHHIPFLEECTDKNLNIVARTHSVVVLKAAMDLDWNITFSFRDPLESIESALAHITWLATKKNQSTTIDQILLPLRAIDFLKGYVNQTEMLSSIPLKQRIRYEEFAQDRFGALKGLLEGNDFAVDNQALKAAIKKFSHSDSKTRNITKSYRRLGKVKSDGLSRLERAYAARLFAPLAEALGYRPYRISPSSYLMNPATIVLRRAIALKSKKNTEQPKSQGNKSSD